MSNQQQNKQQAPHDDHGKEDDDCEDCRRERKQNMLLISMYEKLKKIEGKVERVQSTLKQHQQHTNHDVLNLSMLTNKLEEIDGSGGNDNMTAEAGLQLAKQLIERKARDKLQEQNRGLRNVIQKMRQEQTKRYDEKSRKEQSNMMQKSMIDMSMTDRTVKIDNNMTNDCSLMSTAFINPECQTQKLFDTQDLQSQSTQFLISRPRKQPKKNIIPQLSLWLFENAQNSRLENQLYNSKDMTTKNESYFSKRNSSRYGDYGNYANLPTIRRRTDSKRRDNKLESTRYEDKLPTILRKK